MKKRIRKTSFRDVPILLLSLQIILSLLLFVSFFAYENGLATSRDREKIALDFVQDKARENGNLVRERARLIRQIEVLRNRLRAHELLTENTVKK